jgi:hypothetical protein
MPLQFVQPLLKQRRFSFQLGSQLGSQLGVKVPELGVRHRIEIAVPLFHHMPRAAI